MAKILDSQWNVFSDGQVSDADKVSDNIYKPETGYSSLEHINGQLDQLNVPNAASTEYWEVNGDVVQDGTFTGGSMVGATANIDFFRDPHFADTHRENTFGPDEVVDPTSNEIGKVSYYDQDSQQSVDTTTIFHTDEDFVAVPGASIEFYLPYDCSLVLFTWNIQFEDDGDSGYDGNSYYPILISKLLQAERLSYNVYGLTASQFFLTRTWLRFYIDDAWVPGQERITYPNKRRPFMDGGNPHLPHSHAHSLAPRYWNGHHAASTSNGTQLSKGWHSASIRIYSNSNQSRVRVRGIRHVYFR